MSDKSRRRELIGAVGRKLIIALLLVSAAQILAAYEVVGGEADA